MVTIGITGGIGSGKSVVSELFRICGVPVYDADAEAKKLNDTSETIREQLMRHFGQDLYRGHKLDRKKLARIIFSDPQNLRTANSIIHPELRKNFLEWAVRHSHCPVTGLDAALLFEAKFGDMVDKIVTVYAPADLRIVRAARRDNTDEKSIVERAKHQLPDEIKMKLSDFIIFNDGRHSVIQQVEDLLKPFLQHV